MGDVFASVICCWEVLTLSTEFMELLVRAVQVKGEISSLF